MIKIGNVLYKLACHYTLGKIIVKPSTPKRSVFYLEALLCKINDWLNIKKLNILSNTLKVYKIILISV